MGNKIIPQPKFVKGFIKQKFICYFLITLVYFRLLRSVVPTFQMTIVNELHPRMEVNLSPRTTTTKVQTHSLNDASTSFCRGNFSWNFEPLYNK